MNGSAVPAGVKIISTVMAVYGMATIFRIISLLRNPEMLSAGALSALAIMLLLSILIITGSLLTSQKRKKGVILLLFYFGMFITQKAIQIVLTLAGKGELLMVSQERAGTILMPAVIGTLFHLTIFFYLSSERVMNTFGIVHRSRAIRKIVLFSSVVSLLITVVRIAVKAA